jgi:Skp family chaperone for outer membrane proteins
MLLRGLGMASCVLLGIAAGQNTTTGASPTAAASANTTPSGQYKIAVVNRKVVMEGYKKVKGEYDKLQAEVEERQKPIDKLSDKIQGERDAYEKEKDSLTPTERAERENTIQSEFRQYQAELQRQQADIDSKERLMMKKFFAEMDEVIQKISAEQGYHLILDGSGGRMPAVIYFSPTIDISQKVVDALNGKP